ncbi:MAG: glutamate racemase [Spirochaetaceae bacterium]|jgi:glutamate racemase|nr:glutamate racemase [Spirochaetaceae bacterium]
MNKTVLFFDSGVGGLPYLNAFAGRHPYINAVYIADDAHFPYGAKTKKELVSLLIALFSELLPRFEPVLVVIACNTASVTALAALRERFPYVDFVGTVPAVKPAVLHTQTGKIGILGTERTLADPYIRHLLARAQAETGKHCVLVHRAAPELVDFIEHDFWESSDITKTDITRKYIHYFCGHTTDGIILGCTHFLLLLHYFETCAENSMLIFHSIGGVCRQAEKLLAKKTGAPAAEARDAPAAEKSDAARRNHVYITGSSISEKWIRAAEFFHVNIDLLSHA